jgi:hypothetical protein
MMRVILSAQTQLGLALAVFLASGDPVALPLRPK